MNTNTIENKVTLKSLAERRSDMFHVDPRNLHIKEGLNLRTDYTTPEDEELDNSILANGVQEPLTVFEDDGKIYVSNGHRRFHSVMRLINAGNEIKTVPCISGGRGYNAEKATIDMFNRNSGKPLSTLEQAEGINRLMNWGYTPEQISGKIGKTQAHISNCKALLSLPKSVQNTIRENKIASTLVLEIARKNTNPDTLEKKVKEAIHNAEKAGKKKATKKHSATTPEEKTIRVGEMEFISMLEMAVANIGDEAVKGELNNYLNRFKGTVPAPVAPVA